VSGILAKRSDTAEHSPAAPPASVLGKRETEVLHLIASGKRSAEIAAILGIAPATADSHRRNIKLKLGINSTADLTRYAIREGLIDS
jgi:two-component system NarL family response regulator